MKIVHVQTVVRTVFGVLDNDGNIVNKQDLNLEINRLADADFQAAVTQLNQAKAELESKLPKEE